MKELYSASSLSDNMTENYDFLTHLYNRKYFLEHVEKHIQDNVEFSTFVIDLNRFKMINDVYGHDIGDIVLQEVGNRFKTLENDKILFARFGGDEFAAVYTTTDNEKINELGKKIDEVLEEHIVISESEFTISASVGVSRYPDDSKNISDLLKLADMAMYHAKRSGVKGKYLISDELNNKLALRKKIEALLKNIDVEKELYLEYQPIFDTKSMDLVGVEALVRWHHQTEGTIYPNDFISIAEEIDIVKDITRWVFINALHQIKCWNEKYNSNLKISLNVADSCIHNKIFFGNVKFMLDEFKVKPEWLIIELSELSLSVSPEYMKNLLNSINEIGIDIHIHNFGTSPFMISDLKNFKISKIKIDKKYIHNLNNSDDLSIVKAMILMAQGLGIGIGAEAVETEEQLKLLNQFDCQSFQGFLKAYPVSGKDFEEKYLK